MPEQSTGFGVECRQRSIAVRWFLKAWSGRLDRAAWRVRAPLVAVLSTVGLTVALLSSSPVAAGVDSDGALDVVFATSSSSESRVCVGDGVGGFTCSGVATSTEGDRNVAAGDVDGDGNVDLVFTSQGGGNQACLGDGSAGFACAGVGTDTTLSHAVALGDVNADGDLDAVFANFGQQRNRVCLGDGTGAFTCSDVSPDADDSNDVAVGDVDGDGQLDAVFANECNSVTCGADGDRNRVCIGDGSGSFSCRDVSADVRESIGVALGDVDDDGYLDAVFANSGENRLCLGDGTGGFSCADVSADTNVSTDASLGDIDGDGHMDVVFSNDGARNRVCLGDGAAGFACSDVGADVGSTWDVEVGDVDRDGNLDAVFANLFGQRDRSCLGDGTGAFTCSDVSSEASDSHGMTLIPGKRGTFFDDDFSIFESDIEWLAGEGITSGCNPPVNDMFCPASTVTRGQMAAFLHRALPDLPVVRLAIDFTDDDESVFEADIEWLYSVGVTQGNSATTFNPNAPVTRGQMAAFLVRALKYTDDGGGDLFVDDDSSQFRGDIDRLGTAGVTRGCNPPTNDKFCPDDLVTRGQMAAFLHRALGG